MVVAASAERTRRRDRRQDGQLPRQRLAVVDDRGRLVGVVSEARLLPRVAVTPGGRRAPRGRRAALTRGAAWPASGLTARAAA